MPDAATLGVFAAAALALLVVPGPSVLYIVARGVEGGRSAGLVSMLGVQAGALVHILFAAVGLSAVLASSATAFSIVKWAGAAYLVWLGLRLVLSRDENEARFSVSAGTGRQKLSRAFAQGVVVNVFNPKTALFFLAFLPQFVDPSSGAAWAQIAARPYVRRPGRLHRRPLRPALRHRRRLAEEQGHGLSPGTKTFLRRRLRRPGPGDRGIRWRKGLKAWTSA